MIPVFERANTFYALDRAVTVIAYTPTSHYFIQPIRPFTLPSSHLNQQSASSDMLKCLKERLI
jgi:hypothetical protein